MSTQLDRQPYPSDLTDAHWTLLCPLLPPAPGGGRHRTIDLREVVNAILYVDKNGCAWRALPHDFPPEGTVRHYFHAWCRTGVWERILETLRNKYASKRARRTNRLRPSSTANRSKGVVPAASAVMTQARRSRGRNGICWSIRWAYCCAS